MALLLLVILLVGGLLFFLFSWLIQKLKWWWLLLIVVAYIALLSLTCWISSRTSKSFWRIINDVVMAPMGVVYLVVGLIQPFIVIAGTYFFVSFYAFGIPTLALFGLDKLCGWDLHSSTIAFIVMSLGSIICAHSYSITKKIIHHSFLRNWRNHKYEAYREDLAVYLIHPRNVIFILYLLYFIFLIISGYLQIQSDSYLVSKDFDAAVLKAFLVFIAFTNMKIKAQEADLDVKDLLRRTLLLFVHDEDEGKVKGETGE